MSRYLIFGLAIAVIGWALAVGVAPSARADGRIVITNQKADPEPVPPWVGKDAIHMDHIVLQSGRRIDGEVLAEDDRLVAAEIFVPPGYTLTRKMDRKNIKTW